MEGKGGRQAGEVLFLSRREVEALLGPREVLERCHDTFRWVGSGQVEQKSPTSFWVGSPEAEYGTGFIQSYPAYIKPLQIAGHKWLGGYARNRLRGLPSISAVDVLTDARTAMPLAIVDGTSVTALRTGGHSAVGALYLAPRQVRRVAVVGCGTEGRSHLPFIRELYPACELAGFDPSVERSDAFRQDAVALGLPVRHCATAQEAVEGAELVFVLTSAREPVVKDDWLATGSLTVAINGFLDLDPACARACDKWVVGWYERDLEWVDGPEVGWNGPKDPPYTRQDIHADLASEIAQGLRPGRESPQERIVFTHHGMPALDAAVAALAYEKAIERGAGTVLELF